MAMTPAERARKSRDKKRGRPARTPKPCGTNAAKMRHRRNGEPCATCWPDTLDHRPQPRWQEEEPKLSRSEQ